jgi:hypothetical protein
LFTPLNSRSREMGFDGAHEYAARSRRAEIEWLLARDSVTPEPATGTPSMKTTLLKTFLITTLLADSLRADFVPLALTPDSFNEDVVVEATAPSPYAVPVTTASVDQGKGNADFSWYEKGFNASQTTTGLPAPGTLIVASTRKFRFAPSYTNSNVVLIDTVATKGTLTCTNPSAFSRLSFLSSAGNGAVVVRYTIHHEDGAVQTGTFTCADWFDGANAAYTGHGRVDVNRRTLDAVGSTNPRLYPSDVNINNTNSPVTSIDFSRQSGLGHACIFAVSGLNAGVYSAVDVTGYTEDVVVEKTAARTLPSLTNAITAPMDSIIFQAGWTWYERGYNPDRLTSGLPAAGAAISKSDGKLTRTFLMPPSYTTNNVLFLTESNGVLRLATPGIYNAVSLLTSAANNDTPFDFILRFQDGSSQSGSFISPHWFTGPSEFYSAGGVINLEARSFVYRDFPIGNLYAVDLEITNQTSALQSIEIVRKVFGDAAIFAVSGSTGPLPPKIRVQPSFFNGVPNGTTRVAVSVGGTEPLSYHWFKVTPPNSSVELVDDDRISGANSPILVIRAIQPSDAGFYALSVSNELGSVRTTNALLAILSAKQDVTSPQDVVVLTTGSSPLGEGPEKAFDNTTATHGNLGIGAPNDEFLGPVAMIVTPAAGSSVVSGIRFYASDYYSDTDPATFQLDGSLDGTTYTLIASGNVLLPEDRNATSLPLHLEDQSLSERLFVNTNAYRMYRITFGDVKFSFFTDRLEIGEIELLGDLVSDFNLAIEPSGDIKVTTLGSGELQSAAELNGTNTVWVSEGRITNSVVLPPGNGSRFYRLRLN